MYVCTNPQLADPTKRPHNLAIGSEGSEVIRFLFQITITMQWDLETMLQSFEYLLAEIPSPPGVV